MSDTHEHRGQRQPGAHGETHDEHRVVALNTASEQELSDLPMVGPTRVRLIMERRPFRD